MARPGVLRFEGNGRWRPARDAREQIGNHGGSYDAEKSSSVLELSRPLAALRSSGSRAGRKHRRAAHRRKELLMPLTTMLVCPHCAAKMKTRKAMSSGTRVTCPRCSQSFGITSSGEHLVEEILVARFEDIYGDVKPTSAEAPSDLPPRRAAVSDPGLPRRQGRDTAKPAHAVREPFHLSRTFVVLALSLSFAVLAVGIGGWYIDQITILNRNADHAAELLKTKNERFANGLNKKKEQAAAIPFARLMAPAAKQINNVSLSIFSARIGEVTTKHHQTLPGKYLILTIRITNLALADFQYKGWDTGVFLRDSAGNHYNRVSPAVGDPFAGSVEPLALKHGQTINDILVFENTEGRDDLEVDLPSFGEGKTYEFRLPSMFIQKPIFTFRTPPPPQPPPLPVVPPPAQEVKAEPDNKNAQCIYCDTRFSTRVGSGEKVRCPLCRRIMSATSAKQRAKL